MLISIILWLLSIGIVTCIELTTKLYETIWTIPVTILVLPLFYVLLFIIYLLIVFIWSLFINKKKVINKPNKFYYWMIRQTCHLIISFSRTKIHVTGLDKLPKSGRFVIVNNHTSNFDQIVMMKVLKISPIIFITKPENENIPIAGAFIHKAGFITIDRDNDFNAIKSILKGAKYIEDDLAHISICPEGTRSKSGELLEFKAGAYKVATKVKAPIVTIALTNCNIIHKNFLLKRTHVYFDIVDCLYYEDYKELSTNQIAEMSKEKIQLQINIRKGEQK
ncbi:MAG: 1-acyl-sn-glycerol-3-phosphate acyltransferase [Erysipelotrichales bacterium]|nr:1-acyl-sn-glycerol-3-phosphate acyltransferase [Erysipelotrichales bacterium]